jgi:hypothetical protein
MARVGELDFPQGKVEGSGGTYLLDHAQNASFTAMNRILKAKGKIRWAKKPFTCNGQNYAEGTILASGCSRDFMEKLASSLKLNIQAVSSAPAIDSYEITIPRTGLYQSWVAVEDEGWTRFILDEQEFSYRILHDAEKEQASWQPPMIRLILPDHYSVDLLIKCHQKGTMPPDYVGGLTNCWNTIYLKEFLMDGRQP